MHLIATPISYNLNLYSRLLPLLTQQERKYIRHYTSFERAYESLIARILFKKILGTSNIVSLPSGQPYIADRACHISIAHCEGHVLIAIADKQVGIDIEPIDDTLPKELFMSPTELDHYSHIPTTIWTMKEAYMKFSGRTLDVMDPQMISCKMNNHQWTITDCSIAVTVLYLEQLAIAIVSEKLEPYSFQVIPEKYL